MSPSSRGTKRPPIERIGLVFKPEPRRGPALLRNLIRRLGRRGIEYVLDRQTARLLGKKTAWLERPALAENSDLILVVGGDGTLLAVAREIANQRTPLLGVNLGSLGFLTEVPLDELRSSLDAVIDGNYSLMRRNRLNVEIVRDGRRTLRHEVLNDVVVAKSALARILDIEVTINEHFVTVFQADGLIVCTPTGSTAYSLSAGGPIVAPSVDATILSPICPHTLTNRPIVAPGDSHVQLRLARNHGEVYVTLDGQVGEPFRENDRLIIRRSRHPVSLVHFPQNNYFDVLRKKLKWGGRLGVQRRSG